jgi:diguanylate cyclase (GGDEF)-like protein/PAS domain S-box-containing protein
MKMTDLSNLLKEPDVDFRTRLVDGLLQTSPNLVYVFDLVEKRFLYASGDQVASLGYSCSEIVDMGSALQEKLVHPEDRPRLKEHQDRCRAANPGDVLEVEYRWRHAIGDWHWLAVRETPLGVAENGEARYVLGTAEDMNEHRAAQDKVWYFSTHDQLTGLYNRAFFEAEVGRMEKSRHFPISILFVDIDGIREVNERQGHDIGDALLKRSAQILHESFRAEDIIARVGGDEFAALLLGTGAASTDAILGRVRSRINKNNQSNTNTLLSLSLGFATAEYGQSLREAVGSAERRMLDVKKARQNMR